MMVDLDLNPTKLVEVAEIGKHLFITVRCVDHVQRVLSKRQVFRHHLAMPLGTFPAIDAAEYHAACSRPIARLLSCGKTFQRDHHHPADPAGL